MGEEYIGADRVRQSPLAILLTPLIIPAVIISEVGYRTVQVYELIRDSSEYIHRKGSPLGNRTQTSFM